MNSNQNIRMQDFLRKAEEAQRQGDQARAIRISDIGVSQSNAASLLSNYAKPYLVSAAFSASGRRGRLTLLTLKMMATATTHEQKAMLENMAQTWDALANDRERWAQQKERIAKSRKRRSN